MGKKRVNRKAQCALSRAFLADLTMLLFEDGREKFDGKKILTGPEEKEDKPACWSSSGDTVPNYHLMKTR